MLPIRLKDEDIQRWIVLHGEDTDQGVYFECKCKALKNGKCSIYADRPMVCRNFQVGSPNCLLAIERRRPYRKGELRRLCEDFNRNPGS